MVKNRVTPACVAYRLASVYEQKNGSSPFPSEDGGLNPNNGQLNRASGKMSTDPVRIKTPKPATPETVVAALISLSRRLGQFGADTNDHPAGLQGTWCANRLRCVVPRACPYVRGNPAAYRGQRRRAARQGTHRIGCKWSSRTYARGTGGGISGLGATSPPPAATSRTMSYFSIFRSTNLPALAGSYSVYAAVRP
jgi:hypothetical protein